MLNNVPMLITLAMIVPDNQDKSSVSLLAQLFKNHGWQIERKPDAGPFSPDLSILKGSRKYLVEVKRLSEARPDRAIPLLSQAILQVQASAPRAKAQPLAVIHVGRASKSLLRQIEEFSKRFAPGVAVGVFSEDGAQWFMGSGLEDLNVEVSSPGIFSAGVAGQASNLFSDLNQWMLKVLLAPLIPEQLLSGPRDRYGNASELAKASNVSVMSAFRFVQQLQGEGFLEVHPHLKLVRREELLQRWKSIAFRPSPELNASFLIRGVVPALVRKVAHSHKACLGYHAAAEALRLGHVHGAVPYLYVNKLPRSEAERWKELAPAARGEPFDVVLKQARAPQSLFRGAVHVDGVAVCDVLQIWLDVSAHPSRGQEQADQIWRKVLHRVVE